MSGSRQTRPPFYPVRQLDHVCRVDAEEDVKDFFLLFLLTERTASFYERCLYPVRLAVVPVFSSRVDSVSFSILPSRSSSLRAIFLVWLLLCLRCFLYVRLAFCTSRNFVRGRWIPSLPLISQVVDVAVQLFHQFRAAEFRIHLQEHQGNFPFRREERPVSQLRPHAFPYQTEALCHLAERKQLLYTAKFALLVS